MNADLSRKNRKSWNYNSESIMLRLVIIIVAYLFHYAFIKFGWIDLPFVSDHTLLIL